MKLPAIIVNFKTYEQGIGDNAVRIAKICQELATEHEVSIAVAVNALDVRAVCAAVDIPVLAQHVDGVGYGSHTGHLPPQAVKQAGAYGTLLNHSEDHYEAEALKAAVDACKEQGLFTVVCAPTADASAIAAGYGPDLVAVEPPELIGSGVSVSTTQPELVTDTISAVKKVADVPVLCGAGVVTAVDVSKAIELGTQGVLLASGVLKAEDPKAALLELIKGIKK